MVRQSRDPFDTIAGEETFEVDLNDVSSTGGVIPAGKYPGKLLNIVHDVSKAGNLMWTWTFTITEGQYAGKERRLWTALTDEALWKVKETLLALGIISTSETRPRFTKSDVVGRPCTLVVEESTYNGRPSDTLASILPPTA